MNEDSISEILLCPFCGEKEVFMSVRDNGGGWYDTCSLICNNCPVRLTNTFHVSMTDSEIEKELINMWNKRV